MKYKYERKITVLCPECGRINEEDTEFINIEEGIQGEDILTFICPKCNKERESRRYG